MLLAGLSIKVLLNADSPEIDHSFSSETHLEPVGHLLVGNGFGVGVAGDAECGDEKRRLRDGAVTMIPQQLHGQIAVLVERKR
jgi:hypothetical protein